MRLAFMGTPEFAIPSLEALAAKYAVAAVITQPDRPAGRGRKARPSAIKRRAIDLGLPVLEPERVRAESTLQYLRSAELDLIVVAAYGQILPLAVLEIPPYGCLNVHASLLPRWRGAAPIQAAILHGDETSGVTIMRMDPGLDTGPILTQRATPIGADETGGELGARLAVLGAQLLLDCLPAYLAGDLRPAPQDDSRSTHAPMLRKADGALDPQQTAGQLARQVRAYQPWPGSFLQWADGQLRVHRAHESESEDRPPGTLTEVDGFPALAARRGLLVLDQVQPPGRKSMPGDAFLRGAPSFLQSTVESPSPAKG